MTKYKFTHLLLIIASVIFSVIGILWIFHHFVPEPYPNAEFYIILMMYISMLATTAIIFKPKNIQKTHGLIGFRPTKFIPVLLAVVIACIIWGCDYFYQTKGLEINLNSVATSWYVRQPSLIIVFFSTVIFAPIIEEMLFRGIMLQTLNTYLSKFWSAIILSVAFALVHINIFEIPIDVSQIPTLMFASLIYVGLTYKFNSIIPAIIAHIFNNALTFLYYLSINSI